MREWNACYKKRKEKKAGKKRVKIECDEKGREYAKLEDQASRGKAKRKTIITFF